MRAVKRFYIPLIIVAAVSVSALAQSSQRLRDRDPDLEASKKLAAELQRANFHYGPFYLLSRIRISDAGFSESASLPTGDQSGTVSLSVEAPQRFYFVPHKKTIITAELTPGYSFFRGEGRQGQFNYTAKGDVHFLFNHLYLDVYALREDQLRAFVADINRLATMRTDEVGVAGEAKYSSKTSALFNLRFRDATFPESRYQPGDVPTNLLDRNERNARLSLMHKTFPLTSLFVSGERSDYEFDRARWKDSTRSFFGAGALWTRGRVSMRAEAGPVKLDFNDPRERDYSGLNASIEGSRATARQTYTAALERDIGFSIFQDNNYFVATSANAGVSHSATRRLTLRANAMVERDDYDVPLGGTARRDTISFTALGFIYNFSRLNLGADVGWYQRKSSIGLDEDAGIRTVIHLSFTP